MFYRVLGVIAMVIGALFALVAVLILLPFLSNYNTSLLVLTLIFAIFAWVFLSIGWQLLHPPKPRGHRAVEHGGADDGQAVGSGPEATALRAAPARLEPSEASSQTVTIEPAYARLTPVPAAVVSGDSLVGDAQPASPSDGPVGDVEEGPTTVLDDFVGFGEDGADSEAASRGPNGAGGARSTGGARPQFRKPGAPLPPDRALG
jgi:hypothetical protein